MTSSDKNICLICYSSLDIFKKKKFFINCLIKHNFNCILGQNDCKINVFNTNIEINIDIF